jgi:uridine kinase
MHVDADIRLARRIRRDTVERGRDVISVLEQVFEHCIIVPLSF